MVVFRCQGGHYFVEQNCTMRTLWQYFQNYQHTSRFPNSTNFFPSKTTPFDTLSVSHSLHAWLSLHPPIDLQPLSPATMQFIAANNLQGPDGMISTLSSTSSLTGQEMVLQHECAVLTQLHGPYRVFRENSSTSASASSSSSSSSNSSTTENAPVREAGVHSLKDTAAAPASSSPPSPSPKHGYPLLVGHRTQQAAHEWSVSCCIYIFLLCAML